MDGAKLIGELQRRIEDEFERLSHANAGPKSAANESIKVLCAARASALQDFLAWVEREIAAGC